MPLYYRSRPPAKIRFRPIDALASVVLIVIAGWFAALLISDHARGGVSNRAFPRRRWRRRRLPASGG